MSSLIPLTSTLPVRASVSQAGSRVRYTNKHLPSIPSDSMPSAGDSSSDSSSSNNDMVKVLYAPPPGQETCDIVFFHGLQLGGYEEAWKHTWENSDGVLWPCDWLGKDQPTARILSVSYDSQARKGRMTMDQIGKSLVMCLCKQAGIGKSRPVILVGHSLGGLVLKKLCTQAFTEAAQPGNTLMKEACKSFCSNLAGVFFYATPHGGSNLAGYAKQLFSVLGGAGPVLNYLKVLDVAATSLNNDFINQFQNIRRETIYELKPYKFAWYTPSVMVVPEASAMQSMNDSVGVLEDHITICKPRSRESISYAMLKAYIEERLKEFTKQQQSGSASQQQTLAQTEAFLKLDLEGRYNREVVPELEFLEEQKAVMGERWPEAMFLPPVPPKITPQVRKKILDAMRATAVFWRDVKTAFAPKQGAPIITEAFFSPNWVGRGKHYRLLVEPVDIANWYYKNKHATGWGHYADGIDDELVDDNNKRPGRYLLLQQQEARVFGKEQMQSSLDKARQLKNLLGNKAWEEFETIPSGGHSPNV